jgi:hypothetical protein
MSAVSARERQARGLSGPNYFRFTYGRREDLPRDGCVLERMRSRLVETGRSAENARGSSSGARVQAARVRVNSEK